LKKSIEERIKEQGIEEVLANSSQDDLTEEEVVYVIKAVNKELRTNQET
jgi:hypothetical protein